MVKKRVTFYKKLLLGINVLYGVCAHSGGTVIFENFSRNSISLPSVEGVRQVGIYLPQGYDATDTQTRYPVLYALHRFLGSPQFDLPNYYAPVLDELIASGQIAPMIVVMPDGTYFPYFHGMYTSATIVLNVNGNNINFGMNWERYIVVQLTQFIDANFNTKAEKQFRGISGFEVGGFGAVRLGMLFSDVYQSFSSLSGAGLDIQIFLDQILNMFRAFFILQSTPNADPSIITSPPMSQDAITSKFIASPFNFVNFGFDRLNTNSEIPLIEMFGASAAWSPTLFQENPGYWVGPIPFFAQTVFSILNVPYDGNYNYIPQISQAWNAFNPTLILDNFVPSLQTQNIWLGYGDNNYFFSNRLSEAFAQEPDTISFSNALHLAQIPHILREFRNSEWTPGFVTPATGESIGLSDQIKFHAQIFEQQ